MLGGPTDSQMGSTSAIVLVGLDVGLTNCGSISHTMWSMLCSLRPHWCALPQASMPIRQGDKLTNNAAIWSAATASSTPPCHASSMPRTWNTFLARSMLTIVNLHGGRPFRLKWLVTLPLRHANTGMGRASIPLLTLRILDRYPGWHIAEGFASVD